MGCQESKISSEAHGLGQQATMPEPSTMDDFMECVCGKLDAQTQTEPRKPFFLLDWDSIVCCDGDCSYFRSSNEVKTDPNPSVSHLEGGDDTSQTIGMDTENESETSEPNPAEADSDEDEHQSENSNTEPCAATGISTKSIDAGIKTEDGCDTIHQEQSVNEDGNADAEEKGEIGGHVPETETIPDTEEKATPDAQKATPHAEMVTADTGEKTIQNAEKATIDSQKETPDMETLTTTTSDTEKATQTEWRCTCACMGNVSLDDVDGAMPQANSEQSEHPVGECETVTRSSQNKERIVREAVPCDESVGTGPIPAANEPEYKVKGCEVVMHRIEIQRRIEERRLKAFRDHIQREAVGRREREMAAEEFDNGDYNDNDDITISSCVSAPVGARQFGRIEDRRRKAFEAHLRRRSQTRLAPTGHDR
mmetsp:Transcript_2441/g.5647  ORF Transcript_2441/g.5647 Transcript_2441/m.5647 type:complete len:423 (+) Transcript_2441:310-1578(+)